MGAFYPQLLPGELREVLQQASSYFRLQNPIQLREPQQAMDRQMAPHQLGLTPSIMLVCGHPLRSALPSIRLHLQLQPLDLGQALLPQRQVLAGLHISHNSTHNSLNPLQQF